MKPLRAFAVVAVCALSASMSHGAAAQLPALDANTEASLLQHSPPSSGPIVVNWAFKKGAGATNLTVNPDGTYVFSGQYSGKKPNKDFDVALALKASTGAILLFRYVGDAQQHSGGGGSSVVSTIGDVCSGIASVAGDVGGAVSAIESIF